MTGFLPATHPELPDRIVILTRSAFDADLAGKGWVELDPADVHALAACDPGEIAELAGLEPPDDDTEVDPSAADDVTFGVTTPTNPLAAGLTGTNPLEESDES